MAGRWRIRHKLMVGLALVVGIMALLLVGTLEGLTSYRASMNSIDSKLHELHVWQDLKTAIMYLDTPEATEAPSDLARKSRDARKALENYLAALKFTLDRHRDPDGGAEELNQVAGLAQRFDELDEALKSANKQVFGLDQQPVIRVEVAGVIKSLVQTCNDLQNAIYENLGKRIDQAKRPYRFSMIVTISTSVVGVLLMTALLRFFYRWVFYPIRDLQQGAGRVAQGDFDHRIRVHSGDEMEDLANAFNDMTGRLQTIYADLAHQVNERSRQLVRSERLASVGFLAAGVAHEINNPLASIAFCSEALEVRLSGLLAGKAAAPDADRDVVARYLRMIQQEAFRCKEITQRLLEFSRGGDRKREPAELGELVQSVLDMVQHLQNCKGKEIDFECTGPVTAWVNGQEIKSVVLNLIVNALDSMEEGGRLAIQLDQRDGMALLEFADSGCGMTSEVLENIFEPFFTRSRTGKGTGLGLTISHRIISQHGGEIEAASQGPNQGSRFIVRLPLQPAESVKEEAAASGSHPVTSHPRTVAA